MPETKPGAKGASCANGGGDHFGSAVVLRGKSALVLPPAVTSNLSSVSVLYRFGTSALPIPDGVPALEGTTSPPSYAVMMTLCLPTMAPRVLPCCNCKVNSPSAFVFPCEPGPG